MSLLAANPFPCTGLLLLLAEELCPELGGALGGTVVAAGIVGDVVIEPFSVGVATVGVGVAGACDDDVMGVVVTLLAGFAEVGAGFCRGVGLFVMGVLLAPAQITWERQHHGSLHHGSLQGTPPTPLQP